jgi:hypothetical protein
VPLQVYIKSTFGFVVKKGGTKWKGEVFAKRNQNGFEHDEPKLCFALSSLAHMLLK